VDAVATARLDGARGLHDGIRQMSA